MTTAATPQVGEVTQLTSHTLPGLEVRVRNGCRRWLTWECHFSSQQLMASLPARLAALGFEDVSHFERVAELVNAEGHAVVVVPSTGRVQIRVHYLTPHEERQPVAMNIARLLAEA